MEITRNIKIEDSFINEPDKYRHEIRETTNQWYLKMQSIASEERRNKEIIKELTDVLRYAKAMNDFTGINVNNAGDIIEGKPDKQETKGLAYLFKYAIEQFTDDDRGIRFAKPETVANWESIYRDIFIIWFGKYKIMPYGHFIINDAIKRHIRPHPYLENEYGESNLTAEKAKTIAKKLINEGLIEDCDTNDFIWYFCGKNARKGKQQPSALYWKSGPYNFAYFCYKMRFACKTRSFSTKTLWKDMLLIFSKNEFKSKELADYQSEILDTINKSRKKQNTRTVASKIPTLDTIFEKI